MFSVQDVSMFSSLFRGNDTAYGTTAVGEYDSTIDKTKSTSQLVHKMVTNSVYTAHVNGSVSIGIAPLTVDGNVHFVAIDIDHYDGNFEAIIAAIYYFNIPIIPCWSKSKHLHLYIFFSTATDPEEAVKLAKWYAVMFRCDDKVEIFPKQTKISNNARFYSWINLPYFDANSSNHRKAVKEDGSLMSLPEFVTKALASALTVSEHWEVIETLPFYGSPPCVQSGVLLRDLQPGIRNQWFYNVACYLRMDDEEADIVQPLLDLNSTMLAPLPEREIETTVGKVASRSYFYQCAGMIGCNKKACHNCEKGIGTNKSTKFSFGQLTKILTDPIQWEWEVNGKILRFSDSEQMMSQSVFRKKCMETLNELPYKVKDEKWTAVIRRALDNVIEKKVDLYGNFGLGSSILTVLVDFFSKGRGYATNMLQVTTVGRVLIQGDRYVFSSQQLATYFSDVMHVRVGMGDLRIKLVELGAVQINGVIWSIPIASVPESARATDIQQDYHDTEETSQDNGVQF